MKKMILPIVLLTLVSFSIETMGITDKEREMTEKELTRTLNLVTNAVKGLNNAQLHFKPSPESWSVAECVEHLAKAEARIGGMLQAALKEPANPGMRDSVALSDEKLLGMITSRARKATAPEPFQPTGEFGTHAETLKAFSDRRAAHIDYIKTTEDDLRNHFGKLPFGTLDGVQILLFMSGHTERHAKQMQEVMAHADFPRPAYVPK